MTEAVAALRARRRRTLWGLIAVVIVPLVLTALIAFVIQPGRRPSYGELVQPQRPVPALHLSTLDGRPVDLRRYDGYWLMVVAAPAACDALCQHLLYELRQFDLAAGDERYRVARVWLVTDAGPVNPGVLAPAAGTMILRADPAELARWLPLAPRQGVGAQAPAASGAAAATAAATPPLEGPIWLIDPLGNLMMRFPTNPDPMATLSVLNKLLRNTSSWKPRHLVPLAGVASEPKP